jgi:hypothetical protein
MWTGVWTVLDSSSMLNNIFSWWTTDLISWLLYFLIFIWIISIIWIFKDITARTNSLWLQILGILLVTIFTPIIWLPLYLAVRPVTYKIDKMPRREAGLLKIVSCYNCWMLNDKKYNYCVKCWEILKVKCKECWNQYPHDYQYCNGCGAPNIDV